MKNQAQEKYQLSLLTLLGVVASLGVLPFLIKRYLEGNVAVALIDLGLILGMVTLVSYAHLTQKIRIACVIVAVFINAGVVFIAKTNGINSFLWVYPVFASTFFLVKPLEAFALNVIAGIALVPLTNIFDLITLDSYAMTILMLSISSFVNATHSAKQFRLLETLNNIDALTEALNRRALSLDLDVALSNSERNGTQQLLAILDLDYFKAVNDKYGHAVGDQVLKKLVMTTTKLIRKNDRLYRFGGEEFVLLIPDISVKQQYVFINSLGAAIKNELKTPDGKPITVSFGVAAWQPGTTADTWLKRADKALYQAKARGRDCAVFSDE